MARKGLDEFGKDTAYYIFKELYLCRIPYIQMLTADEIKDFGVPHIGIAEFDYQQVNELREIMIPISAMVEYWDRGAQIRVVKLKDTERIYNRISDHLNAWKRHLDTSLNVQNAPFEDLRKLDEFANVVYEHAKYQFTSELVDSYVNKMLGKHEQRRRSFIDNMRNVRFDSEGNVIKRGTEIAQSIENRVKHPVRKSMAEFFVKPGTTQYVQSRTFSTNQEDPNQPYVGLNQTSEQQSGPRSMTELFKSIKTHHQK